MSKVVRVFRNSYFLIVLFSLLPFSWVFLSPNLIHTHDSLVHLARMAAYYKALGDGQFPVRWAGDLNYGYGMPLFNFIYPLPYFISSLLLFLGFGLADSFKIVLFLSFLFSGLFMYWFAKKFFQDKKKAILATFFYQFAPFRLIEVLLRGDIGEIYTYTFLPLVLFGILQIFKTQSRKAFILTSFSGAFLILSHNSVSLLFFLTTFLFVFFFAKTKKNFLLAISSLLCGMLISAFYWIPAILEHKYTHGDLYMQNLYQSYFPYLSNLFIPNPLNLKHLQIIGVSTDIGFFHILAIVISIFAFSKIENRWERQIILFSFILIIISIFFMQPFSKIFWQNLTLLRQFQFPWRFLSLIVFASSLLSVFYLRFPIFNKRFIFSLLIFLTIIYTAVYWNPVLGFDIMDEEKEAYYWNFPLTTTYYGETDVVWSAGPAKSYPKKRVEVIDGEATILNFAKKSNLHKFQIDAKTDVMIVDHIQFFPGWRVFVNNKEVPVQFQDPHYRGEIEFSVPKGRHKVSLFFGETKIRLFADLLSLSTFSILTVLFITQIFRYKFFFKKRQ